MKETVWLKRLTILLFAIAGPWLNAAPNYLFVFERAALEARVYDVSSLTATASLTVGRGAIEAFSIPDSAGEPEKFLVVSENGVSIFNADFSPRGTLFLSTQGLPLAAELSHDRNLLAVAAGRTLFLVDTRSESIHAEIELGFAASGLAFRGDAKRVYLISSAFNHVRVVDVETGEIREEVLLLPEPPGAITAAADGSRVYLTTRGAIYALDQRAETFLTPIVAASADEPLRNLPAILGPAANQPLIDRLVVGARGRFFLRRGPTVLRGVLGAAGTATAAVVPPDAPPADVVDLAASPDGRLLYLLTQTGKLIEWDAAAAVTTGQAVLSSSPDAVSLTSPPIARQGSLNKFSGDGQTVQSGSTFSIVARALDDNGDPQPGVVINFLGTFPGVSASCDSPLVATDSDGLAMVSCDASVVSELTLETIGISDDLDRTPSPPFSVLIAPSTPAREGLQKLAGDGQVVTEGESFSTTFKVTDFVSDTPQEGAVISVSDEPNGVVSCAVSDGGVVDVDGEAAFTCSALDLAETAVVHISVSDDGGRTIADPFAATVVDESVPVSGLTILSGDNQTVLRNSSFPEPLRVSDRFGGEPREDALLTVSTSPGGVVSCGNGVRTDSSGVGTIHCTAGPVDSTTNVQISVVDEFLQDLDTPFSATILSECPPKKGWPRFRATTKSLPAMRPCPSRWWSARCWKASRKPTLSFP